LQPFADTRSHLQLPLICALDVSHDACTAEGFEILARRASAEVTEEKLRDVDDFETWCKQYESQGTLLLQVRVQL
jgi:hypothetical protein